MCSRVGNPFLALDVVSSICRGTIMDAAQTFTKKIALFLVTASLAVTATAQTLVVSPTTVTIGSSTQSVPVTVTSSTGAPIAFTVLKANGDTGFYSLSPTAGNTSTSNTVFVSLANARAFDTTGTFTITN